MKLLSIHDSKGYFLADDGGFKPLDQLSKDDLLRLVDLTLTADCQMDDYDAALLQNQAHQIIYENLWSRLRDLASRKKEFLDESKRQYLNEYERYSTALLLKSEGEERTEDTTVPRSPPD